MPKFAANFEPYQELRESLSADIEQIKNGKMTSETARVVIGARRNQLKLIDQALQFMRITKGAAEE